MFSEQVHSEPQKDDAAFLRGIVHAFGVPAFCYWSSCLAFGFFARDAGLDWVRGLAAAAMNWPSSTLLIITAGIEGQAMALVAATALLSALSLLPIGAMISHQTDGGVMGKLLLAPTMTYTVWVAVSRAEASPHRNRRAFVAGVCLTFLVGNLLCTGMAWFAPFALPMPAMMGLGFIMPLFYGLNLLGGAASASSLAMLALAFFLEPLVAGIAQQASVLIAGIGSFALVLAFRRWRRP